MLDAGRLTAGSYTVKVTPVRGKGKGKGLTATLVVAHKVTPGPSPTASPSSPAPVPTPTTTRPSPVQPTLPVPTKTTPVPVPTKTIPAPIPTKTHPAPVPTKTIPAPVPTKTIPAPVPTKTIPAPVPTKTTAPAPTSPGTGSFASEVVRLTNVERSANGCSALSIDSKLTAAAQLHSEDMAAKNYFEHSSPDGRSAGDRISAQGYKWRSWGENIAAGQKTPASVVSAWMNSSGHRANILNCGFTQIGVGIAKGGSYGIYWTQNFGTPA
ncbi:MAG: CAP domain-containing protein [Kineosporiaceae bacterium]|nr:CAP domain-containing protein [Kineosporiaceae bacterium]